MARRLINELSLYNKITGEGSQKGREVFPGVTAVSDDRKVRPKEESPYPIEPTEAIKMISDPNNALTSVNFPDGTSLQGAYVPPTQPPAQGGQNPNWIPVSPEHAGFQGTVANAGEFLARPDVQYMLGQLASAVGTEGKVKSFGAQLGEMGMQSAQQQAYANYLAELQKGTPIEEINKNPTFSILTPEQRTLAQQQVLAGQKLGLAQQQVGIEQQRANTYDRLAQAQIEGTLTAEDKKKLEELQIATQAKIGEMAHRYLRLNQIDFLDTTTGEVFSVPNGDISKLSGKGNLNASLSKIFRDDVATLYLDKAMQGFLESLSEKEKEEWSSMKILSQIFDYDPTKGSISWEKVFKYLSPQDRVGFSKELARFAANTASGVPPEFSFATSPLLKGDQGQQGTPAQKGEKPKVILK